MVAVAISPVLNEVQYFDNDGLPLSGGKIATYTAGSFSSQQTSYTGSDGNVQNANPMVLDSSGRPPQAIWLIDGYSYNMVLYAPNGTTVIKSFDNITGGGSGGEVANLVVDLSSNSEDVAKFNGDAFTAWSGDVLVESDDVSWNNTTKQITFLNSGTYRIEIWGQAEPDPLDTGDWPEGFTYMGSYVETSESSAQISSYFRTYGDGAFNADPKSYWSDVFVQPVFNSEENATADVGLYCWAYDFRRNTPIRFSGQLIVTRLGGYTPV